MSTPTPPPTPEKTEARVDALRDVVLGLISYDPLRGTYIKSTQVVTGARGRTLRELRTPYELIRPGNTTKVAKVLLTEAGEQVAVDWGLKSAPPESGNVAAEQAAE